jgi:uncharacterized membrane protein YdbT with pleckstrin-like domain
MELIIVTTTYSPLLATERVSYATKKHLVIFVPPLVLSLMVWLMQQFFGVDNRNNQLLSNMFLSKDWQVLLPWLAILYLWLKQLLSYLSASYLVTDRRVMLREGFVLLRASEINLLNVGDVSVEQSLFGRLFNYGSVSINSFGGGTEILVLIAGPNAFKQQIMTNQLLLTSKISKS